MKKSLIEKIYLEGKEIEPSEKYGKLSEQSFKLYNSLMKMLNDNQKIIFNEYSDLRSAECAESELTHFKEGVKFGYLFCRECDE